MRTYLRNQRHTYSIKIYFIALCLWTLANTTASVDAMTKDHISVKKASTSKTGLITADLQSSNAYKIAKHIPVWHTATVNRLATYINKNSSVALEKAQIIYCWVALNISYDDKNFNSNKSSSNKTAEATLLTRKGLCGGYSNLFHQLCTLTNLESQIIYGYAKGYGYRKGRPFKDANHAWNAVKINNQWQLIDVTWGSGSGTSQQGKLKSTSEFDAYYFCTPPEAFVLTHLPEDEQYQFIDAPLSLKEYEKMPRVSPTLFKLGFPPSDILANLRTNPSYSLPETYHLSFSIEGIPCSTTLKSEEPIEVHLTTDKNLEFAIINNSHWTHLKKEGKNHTASLTPKGGKLAIGYKKKTAKEYDILIRYKVVR